MSCRKVGGTFFLLVGVWAGASPRIQPVDVIEATPLETFSDRTGTWPSESVPTDRLLSNGISFFESADRILGLNTRGSLSKGSPAFSLRGSVGAGRVLSLYDGVPLNLADGVGAQELLLPREAIEQLSILRGPSSVFYGSSAMSGGINFIPSIYLRPRLRASIGSFGQKGLFAAAPLLTGDNDKLQVTAFNESIEGDYAYKSLSSLQSGTRTRTDTHTQRFTASGEHSRGPTDIAYRAIYGSEFGSSPGSETFPNPTLSRKNAQLYALSGSHHWNDRWNSKLRLSFTQTENKSLSTSQPPERLTRAYQSVLGAETSYLSSEDWKLTGLMEAKEDFYSVSATQNNVDRKVRKSEKSYEPGAVFEAPLAENIRIQTGARYLPDYGVVVKALGARQTEGPREFYVNYSEGFRAPSLSDKYEDDPFFVGNPNLKPEKSQQIEAGLKQDSQRYAERTLDRFAFAGSVYSISYEDLMVSHDIGAGVYSKRNEESATAFGAEAQAGYPFRFFSIEAGYAYIDAKARGRPVQFTTEQQYFLAIAHYFGPLVMELRDTLYNNYQYGSAPQDTWTWNTVDFTIRTIGLNDYSFQAGLLNILDQPRMYSLGYPEPQRRFFISLERVF